MSDYKQPVKRSLSEAIEYYKKQVQAVEERRGDEVVGCLLALDLLRQQAQEMEGEIARLKQTAEPPGVDSRDFYRNLATNIENILLPRGDESLLAAAKRVVSERGTALKNLKAAREILAEAREECANLHQRPGKSLHEDCIATLRLLEQEKNEAVAEAKFALDRGDRLSRRLLAIQNQASLD